jgi:shikimate kinase
MTKRVRHIPGEVIRSPGLRNDGIRRPRACPRIVKTDASLHSRAMAKHVTLIGMMGAGKSTVAPLLAAQIGRQAIEVDGIIEKEEGMPIGEIFIAKGEAYFRRAEHALIAKLITQPPAVLSLGGGAFQWEDTRKLLLEHTVVFYLSATLDVLCSRLQGSTSNRPLLAMGSVDLQSTVRDLLERRGLYYGMAHYRVETDFHDPAEVARSLATMREAYD